MLLRAPDALYELLRRRRALPRESRCAPAPLSPAERSSALLATAERMQSERPRLSARPSLAACLAARLCHVATVVWPQPEGLIHKLKKDAPGDMVAPEERFMVLQAAVALPQWCRMCRAAPR